jgi:hypothetical protein
MRRKIVRLAMLLALATSAVLAASATRQTQQPNAEETKRLVAELRSVVNRPDEGLTVAQNEDGSERGGGASLSLVSFACKIQAAQALISLAYFIIRYDSPSEVPHATSFVVAVPAANPAVQRGQPNFRQGQVNGSSQHRLHPGGRPALG